VSTLLHEGHEGSAGGSAPGTEGLHEDPHNVVLSINGYEDKQGYADKLLSEVIRRWHVDGDSYINWKRIAIPRLYLEHAAHLLFIQGISPTQFFMASGLTWYRDGVHHEIPGPLIFISGALSAPYEVPAHFSKLVLGQLMKASSEKVKVADTCLAMARYEAQRHLKRGA
jgi:hypothetical protein